MTYCVAMYENNQYFKMPRSSWGEQLRHVFEGMADSVWDEAADIGDNGLQRQPGKPLRVAPPAGPARHAGEPAVWQTLAQSDSHRQP